MNTRDELVRITLDKSPLRSLPFEVWHGELDTEAALAGKHPKRAARSRTAAASGDTQIPAATVYTLKRRSEGIVVRSAQRALNVWGASPKLLEDGVYGKLTELAASHFQEDAGGLVVDGVFGPRSQAALSEVFEDDQSSGLPKHLLGGQVLGESGRLWGAVNWAVPGGVDCHLTQRRLYSSDLGDASKEWTVFNSWYQLGLSAKSLNNWKSSYQQAYVINNEFAWRCSAQHHNYPSGADAVAEHSISGLTGYYYTAQDWVERIGVKFRDGANVNTPLEWMQFYALGAPAHNTKGLVTQFVTDWN